MAIWDLYIKRNNLSIKDVLGIEKDTIDAGITFGLLPIDRLISNIDKAISDGYKRVKIKIEKGNDVDRLSMIREVYPNIGLCVDANGSYTINDINILKELDEYNLLFIEEPLCFEDRHNYELLTKEINTSIIQDESIKSLNDIEYIKSGFNIKLCKIGSISKALEIYKYLKANNYKTMVGSMMESGISRVFHIALAGLNHDYLPDLSDISRYFGEDLIKEKISVDNGQIIIIDNVNVDIDVINKYCIKKVSM
jgi:O-succinylbenzoate synthase